MRSKVKLAELDDGIREFVALLWKAGYETFTSCEGGHRHPFRHPTIGLRLKGDYFKFRDRLAKFLRRQGCETFEISLMTRYHPDYPAGEHDVWLESLDILSPTKYRERIESMRRRDQRLLTILRNNPATAAWADK